MTKEHEHDYGYLDEVTSSTTLKETSRWGQIGETLTYVKKRYQCKVCGNYETRDAEDGSE